jgi:hypothetical protein
MMIRTPGMQIRTRRALALLLGLCCTVVIQGCATPQQDVACVVQGETTMALWGPFNDQEAANKKARGVGAPGACAVTRINTAQSAYGWVVLGANGLPNGQTAPPQATCIIGTSKCTFPGLSGCDVDQNKVCKHAVFLGNGNWSQPKACTCICKTN